MSDASLKVLEVSEMIPEKSIKAIGKIPEKADFFQDHFPDFPILPGVLALDLLKQTAEILLRHSCDEKTNFIIDSIRSVKFARYLQPGDDWESQVELLKEEGGVSKWKGKLLKENQLAVNAQFQLKLK